MEIAEEKVCICTDDKETENLEHEMGVAEREMVFFTSWLSSMAHSLADWALASTMTLNMVHID